MKDENGLTCNCGVIHGGTVANSVADTCAFTADIRFSTQEQLEEAKEIIKKVSEHSVIAGCSCDVKEVSFRPAMEKREINLKLFDKINAINEKVGLPRLSAHMDFGGSDTAYTTIAGIPCIDCLGVVGQAHHSINEFMIMGSLLSAAKQQAAIILMI